MDYLNEILCLSNEWGLLLLIFYSTTDKRKIKQIFGNNLSEIAGVQIVLYQWASKTKQNKQKTNKKTNKNPL